MTRHVVVWIDYAEARIFHLHRDSDEHRHEETATPAIVQAPQHRVHRHPKGHSGEATPHPDDRQHFFSDVQTRLTGSGAILIVGPASAKHELFKFLLQRDTRLAARVVGVETLDHPSDGQIIAYARTAFRKSDRMAG